MLSGLLKFSVIWWKSIWFDHCGLAIEDFAIKSKKGTSWIKG